MSRKPTRLSLAAAVLSVAMLASCGAPAGSSSSTPDASTPSVSTPDSSQPVSVEPLEVQTFPCSTTEEFTALFQEMMETDPDNLYYHPYTGLFQEPVEAEGLSQTRTLYTYIPDETRHCASSVFVAIPAGEKAEEFLVSSGWTAVADEYKFLLHAMTPAGDQWGEEDEELAYLAAAYNLGTKTINYSPYTGNYYFVGYGDGGRLLEQWVMANPDNCSGLVVLDGGGISGDYLDQMAQTPAVDPDKTVSQVNVPVWLIEAEVTDEIQTLVDYWSAANDCTDTAYLNQDVSMETTVYLQDMLSNDAFINAYPLGRIQITQAQVSYTNPELSATLWETFLCKAQRYRSLAGNDLRPAIDYEELGFTKEERTIDGYSRYWLEYVPQSVKDNPDEEVPLVMALHGAGQCAEAYAPYSEWFKVAEEAGFIVVFPTAYPYAENNGMARPIHNDCWDPSRPDDVSFWRQLIQDVSDRYPVDASRIYATGHSNGGNSSAMIAGEMSDVVAAVAISAGRFRNVEQTVTEGVAALHDMASTYPVPVIQMVGTNDAGAYQSPSMTSTMMYFLERNGCQDLANPLTYQTSGYHNQIWCNEDGIPMVRYTVIEDKPHTTTPSESRLFWYEFLCHYARGEDGSVLYMQDDTIIRE